MAGKQVGQESEGIFSLYQLQEVLFSQKDKKKITI